MNITGYKKHLQEMIYILEKAKEKDRGTIKINKLERSIISCNKKIKELQIKRKEKLKHRKKRFRSTMVKGRRRTFAKKKRGKRKNKK